jgi:hypothetical protein
MRSEWNRSLVESNVESPAVLMELPNLRIMLISAEFSPLSNLWLRLMS